jgi:hypothetical protein
VLRSTSTSIKVDTCALTTLRYGVAMSDKGIHGHKDTDVDAKTQRCGHQHKDADARGMQMMCKWEQNRWFPTFVMIVLMMCTLALLKSARNTVCGLVCKRYQRPNLVAYTKSIVDS